MRKAILLVSIFSLAGCATLQEFFGQDPLSSQQASCPVLPMYDVPELANVSSVYALDEDGNEVRGLDQTQMENVGNNFSVLINTIKKYQSAVSTYNAAYTEPTGE